MTTKKHYWKYRDKLRAKNREYYQNNQERLKKQHIEWCRKNPDKVKAWKTKYRDKYNARRWAEDNRVKLLKLKGNKCKTCGSQKLLEFHHKKYESKNPDVIEVLCKKCHVAYHVKIR